MKKIIRLTEQDLATLLKGIVNLATGMATNNANKKETNSNDKSTKTTSTKTTSTNTTSTNSDSKETKKTDTITFLHQIAEKVHRRSMIILFTDMFIDQDNEKLFSALQHLKHNKHKVVLFHVFDKKTELNFDFDNTPRKFIDMETGEEVNLFAENMKESYEKVVNTYFENIAITCASYKIKYVPVSVDENFEKILTTYSRRLIPRLILPDLNIAIFFE